MEELELSEEWVEDTWKELEQARGEKLIKGTKKRSKKLRWLGRDYFNI